MMIFNGDLTMSNAKQSRMEKTAMFSMRLDKEIKKKLLDLCQLEHRSITHQLEWLVLKEWDAREEEIKKGTGGI
jgi:hypothetical protein